MYPRRHRQRNEIIELATRRPHRAADLAHVHLAEFPDDTFVRCTLVEALERSPDPRVRQRAREFADAET